MRRSIYSCCLLFLLFFLLYGCSRPDPGLQGAAEETAAPGASGSRWDNTVNVRMPQADGICLTGNDAVTIDISNTADGYLMARYNGAADKIKFFITTPDRIKYTYDLMPSGQYSALPLTGGSGDYTIQVMEHVQDSLYSTLYSETLPVEIKDEFSPFLYPNQYTWFTAASSTVQKAAEITADAADALDALGRIYNYVIHNIRYDEEKARTVTAGYLPDVDETLSTGFGICFDYAAVMTAMLRSQGIPAKLEIGYSGEVYHAWISAYIDEKGWISNIIYFDGQSWSLLDPTLAAANNAQSVREYIGDGSNYTVKYSR